MSQFERYSRQMMLSQIQESGQARLSASRVLLVGAGGLGCHVGIQLAGAGIGQIHLLDHDVISLSNLHRQILFREQDLGQLKAEVAARELSKLNSTIRIEAQTHRLALDNVEQLTQNSDLVIDATDNFVSSYILSDACTKIGVPLLSASVNRSYGYLGVFCGSETLRAPSYRAVFPRLPDRIQSCDLVGVSGPGVGIIGSLQAQEAIKILLKDRDQLMGKLLYCDLWNYKQHIVDFSSAGEPRGAQIEFLGVDDLRSTDWIVDVRSAPEVTAKPQVFSVSQCLPLSELRRFEPRIEQRVVLACQSGQRALIAGQQLWDQGVIDLAVLIPGSTQS